MSLQVNQIYRDQQEKEKKNRERERRNWEWEKRENSRRNDCLLRASASVNAISSHFTILKSYFINYTIPFYNTLNIPKFFFFFPFYLNILFYSFFYYISFSIPFPLFLPHPLALVLTHRATHRDHWYTEPIQTHHHTHTHKNKNKNKNKNPKQKQKPKTKTKHNPIITHTNHHTHRSTYPEPSLIFFHLHTKQKLNTIQECQTQKKKKKNKPTTRALMPIQTHSGPLEPSADSNPSEPSPQSIVVIPIRARRNHNRSH